MFNTLCARILLNLSVVRLNTLKMFNFKTTRHTQEICGFTMVGGNVTIPPVHYKQNPTKPRVSQGGDR